MPYPFHKSYCETCKKNLHCGVPLCEVCRNGVWPKWDIKKEVVDDSQVFTFYEWHDDKKDEDVIEKHMIGSWGFLPKDTMGLPAIIDMVKLKFK